MRVERWHALGTTAAVAVTDDSALDAARAAVTEVLDDVDRACSRFRGDSELAAVNAAAGSAARVSPLLLEALRASLGAATATGGAVDPTIGRTLRLWGYDRTFTAVADREPTFEPTYAAIPGWRTVELDEKHMTVRVPNGVELDLGATAKALAADWAAARAAATTGTGVLVSLGGDVAVAGDPPVGGWPIRIADDSSTATDVNGPVVTVSSGGLASSSTSIRRWRTRHGELHHIVDPRTSRPATSRWRLATVAAASCVEANTASTAAIVLGEHAVPWLRAARLPARLVDHNGRVTLIEPWPEGGA